MNTWRVLLDLPGRAADRALGAAPAPDETGNIETPLVRSSPRANAYLSLEPGLRVFRRGDHLLTYHAQGRDAFVVGGLHGPRDSAAGALRELGGRLASAGFRRVLLFPVSRDELNVVRAAGFDAIHTGSEAFCDPTRFFLAGKPRADLRQMLNRASRRSDLELVEMDPARHAPLLRAVYDAWLAERPVKRRLRLLVGTPMFDRPEGRRYFAVMERDAHLPAAFLTLTPGWSGAGFGVDVMARLPDAPAGAMDLLIYGVIRRLAEQDVRLLSLGACPMSERAPVGVDDKPLLRVAFRVLEGTRLGNEIFRFRSLAHFKGKFAERWEPVYVACRGRVTAWSLYAGCRMWGLFAADARRRSLTRGS
ncbi:MAG: DUF2156 domain-containing protein [Deltaproteobacteria bacterium]|nr:DUF2156 domain-containing protein [Deltaproteobacteria bacterium]